MLRFHRRAAISLAIALIATSAAALAQGSPSPQFGRIAVDSLTWRGNPAGVQLATIEGDPMAPGKPYSVALRLAPGAWIAPHWHPRDQHVIVLSGTLLLGHGERLDSLNAAQLPQGAVGFVPAESRHYEGARMTTTIVLYGIGPMTTTFVTPSQPERPRSPRH
jgi:mannose-6-phosphate isomerase-like protein (cupin superfamily)